MGVKMARNDSLARIADSLAEMPDVTVTVREDAHLEPRTETRTRTKRDSKVVPTGAGVTTETVEEEVEREVVVGEKRVVDDRWLEVEADSHEAVREMAAVVRHAGLSPDEAVAAVDVGGEAHEYEIRA